MVGYVFVYSRSRFRVGAQPLVRFAPGQRYDERNFAIAGGAEGEVDRGIYAIASDAIDIAPELTPVGSRSTIDYDVSLVKDKDPWPTLTGSPPHASVDSAMRERVRQAFPELRDEDLRNFHLERG